MLGDIWSRPASAWQRITLPALTRLFRTPKVLDERIHLKGYPGPLRQVTVIDLGHEEPTILLTNNQKITLRGPGDALRPTHADRKRHRRGGAVLSSGCLVVDGRLEGRFRPADHAAWPAPCTACSRKKWVPVTTMPRRRTLFRNLLDVSATVAIEAERVVVTLDKRRPQPFPRQIAPGRHANPDALVRQQAAAPPIPLNTIDYVILLGEGRTVEIEPRTTPDPPMCSTTVTSASAAGVQADCSSAGSNGLG